MQQLRKYTKSAVVKKTYICNRCRLQIDRENASINILNRATAGYAGSCARKICDTTGIAIRTAEPITYSTIHKRSPYF